MNTLFVLAAIVLSFISAILGYLGVTQSNIPTLVIGIVVAIVAVFIGIATCKTNGIQRNMDEIEQKRLR